MSFIPFRTLFLSSLTVVTFLAAHSSAEAGTLVSVDLGTTTQSGFQQWNVGADGTGLRTTTFTITDFVSVPGGLLTAYLGAGNDATNINNDSGTINTRIRANAPANSGSFTLTNLLNDRVVSTTGAGTGLFLSLSGFAPSTTFTIQVWGYDTQNSPATGAKPGTFTLYDRTAGANTSLGSFTTTAGQLPTDNNTFSVIGTVTSDANGVIVVESISNMDGTGIMNGFVVSTVPEPAATSLALCGIVTLAARRRRRPTAR
ncbi:MAG TPA: hypothetical protein VK961_07005 [Chthoniobacter sp.]|nr:hypothetical protein [Chthoniobacter sp.]